MGPCHSQAKRYRAVVLCRANSPHRKAPYLQGWQVLCDRYFGYCTNPPRPAPQPSARHQLLLFSSTGPSTSPQFLHSPPTSIHNSIRYLPPVCNDPWPSPTRRVVAPRFHPSNPSSRQASAGSKGGRRSSSSYLHIVRHDAHARRRAVSNPPSRWPVSRVLCPRTSSPPRPPTATTMASRGVTTARLAATWQVALLLCLPPRVPGTSSSAVCRLPSFISHDTRQPQSPAQPLERARLVSPKCSRCDDALAAPSGLRSAADEHLNNGGFSGMTRQ